MIDLFNVTKFYRAGRGYKSIVDDISGTIPKRNIGILGANGAGKSTLMRCRPGGAAEFGPHCSARQSVFSRWVHGSFNPELSGAENALFLLGSMGGY